MWWNDCIVFRLFLTVVQNTNGTHLIVVLKKKKSHGSFCYSVGVHSFVNLYMFKINKKSLDKEEHATGYEVGFDRMNESAPLFLKQINTTTFKY